MTQFPPAPDLPAAVIEARAQRQRELVRTTVIGITIRMTIILLELFGVWLYGSTALLYDALASIVDIFSSVVFIIFVFLAARPPDRNHPFGHGRYEPFVGMQLGTLLLAIGATLCTQQLFELAEPSVEAVSFDTHVWIIPAVAVILLEFCYRLAMHTARRQHSTALAADAIHYRIDGLTSLLAMITLICAPLFPAWGHYIDHLGATAIAILMIGLGGYAALSNFHQLMDRAPDPEFFTLVKGAARQIDGVLGTEKIRIQQSGPDAHVDIDIEVSPDLSVDAAHRISQLVRVEIQKKWPAVRDVIVHIEPYYPNDH
jgi:cation diffusion facilitator family transporter